MNKHALVALHELGKLAAVFMILTGVHYLYGVAGVAVAVGGYIAVQYFRYRYMISVAAEAAQEGHAAADAWMKEIDALKDATLKLAEEHQDLQKKGNRTKEEDMRMKSLEASIESNIRRAQEIGKLAEAKLKG